MLQAQGLPLEQPTFKTDPRWVSWVGGSVIPKLEGSREMWVTREKWMAKFLNWERHLETMKSEAERTMKQQILVQRQAAKKAQLEAAANANA